MKVLSIIAVTLIATSAHANLPQSTDPQLDAQCSAVFRATSIQMERVSPQASQTYRSLSNNLMTMSTNGYVRSFHGHVRAGSEMANGFYNRQLDSISNAFRGGNGTQVLSELVDVCKPSLKQYGFIK
jgi:hypothetical protein